MFQPDQYFSFPVTKNILYFLSFAYSRWQGGTYCFQCVLFSATYPGKNIIISFLNHIKTGDMKHQSRLKVLQKLYIINNVIFRPHWLKPFSN